MCEPVNVKLCQSPVICVLHITIKETFSFQLSMYINVVANMYKPLFSRSSVAILLILACSLLATAISFSSCPEENELEMLLYTLEKSSP